MSPSRSRSQYELDENDYGPSRSQQRREALAVLALAGQLVELPPSRLRKLGLPEDVLDEIANVHRIGSHIARKRQLAFLAKVMRRHGDDAFATARAELGENRERKRQEAAALHRLEAWRERLLEDDASVAELIEAHPDVDRQHLRSLVRQARTERAGGKAPRAFRELFQLLRDLVATDGEGEADVADGEE